MDKIMENPGQIPGANMNVFTGEQLVKFFFNRGGDAIPKELRDKGWWPKDEETKVKKLKLIDELCEKIRNMSLDRLIDLDIYIQRGRHN